ncbi:AAA family ATPase [Herbaspirillum sp.]|uniref:AAA family ATPase n=1 Tax=Herbaspirillum sp. TaxID=1890675 RepID=UPI001B04B00C|nr:AAA family ATPase [Herbaspirillum sp.]MBO9537644.1 AAA family ATPase [Herbaspirillum sp.]
MKIAVISPHAGRLTEMGAVLRAQAHQVSLAEGDKHHMRLVAEQERPDLMLVDGSICDMHDLSMVEKVTASFPQMAVILLCATQNQDFLIGAMRAGVREVLPSPAPLEALNAAVGRVAAKQPGGGHKAAGKILAFMSCKGGSGATFLATNLGYQLARTSSVLLIDLNLQFGDALSFVHEERPSSTLADVVREIKRLDALFLAGSAVQIAPNYSILAAPEDPAQALTIKPEHLEAILALAVSRYDFILLDVGRSLDVLSIKALDRAHKIFPVIQASLPDLRHARKLLALFKSLDYPQDKVELVVNRFSGNGEIGLDEIRRTLSVDTIHTIPNSFKEVNDSINHGDLLAEMQRSNAIVRNLASFALSLGSREEESRGFFERLFKR